MFSFFNSAICFSSMGLSRKIYVNVEKFDTNTREAIFTTSSLENSSLAVLSKERESKKPGAYVIPKFNPRLMFNICMEIYLVFSHHHKFTIYNFLCFAMHMHTCKNVGTQLWRKDSILLEVPLHLQGLSPRTSHSCSHPAIVLRCWLQIRHMNTCQITEGYVCLKRGLLVWCSSAIPPSYRYVVLFRIRTSQWLKITALASKPCFIWRALKN